MKKLNIILLLAVMTAGAAFSQDTEYAITLAATNSYVILPPRKAINADAVWVAETAVTQGQVLANTNKYYMVLVAGTTATNAPTNTTGRVEVNGTATLIHCLTIPDRTQALVTLESDADIWFHTGKTATTNGGEFACVKGQQYIIDTDEAVSAFSTSAIKLNVKDK